MAETPSMAWIEVHASIVGELAEIASKRGGQTINSIIIDMLREYQENHPGLIEDD